MTWVRIDDQAPIHPKLHRAGPEAAWLWVAGLAYCNRFATDGRIDALDLDTLYQYDGWDLAKVNSLAARLVEVGLWEPTKGGWQVHHYAEYQGEALRSARDERRKWEAERKARQRAAAKAKQKSTVENSGTSEQLSQWDRGGTGVGHVPGTQVGHEGGTPARQAQGTPASEATREESVSQPPDPSRPVPTQKEIIMPSATPEASASGARTDAHEVAPQRPARASDEAAPGNDTPAGAAAAALASTSILRGIVRHPHALCRAAVNAYPAVDIPREIAAAEAWLVANPKNKKKNGDHFLNGWLGRAQERAPRVETLFTRPPPPKTRGPAPLIDSTPTEPAAPTGRRATIEDAARVRPDFRKETAHVA